MEDLESHRTLQITISVSRHGKSWKLMMHQQIYIYIYLLHDCFHSYFGNNTLTVGHGKHHEHPGFVFYGFERA